MLVAALLLAGCNGATDGTNEAPTQEFDEVFRFAGEKRATIHTHARSMTVDAMQEVLANAVGTGAPLHIVHVNSMALGEIDTVLGLIGGARRLGLDVTTEAYPYTAGSTSLHSSIFDEGWQGRLGIDYDALRAVNPGIILASLSGYGDEGFFGQYLAAYNEMPNFSYWGDEEEAFAKMRAGFQLYTRNPAQAPHSAAANVPTRY